MKGVERESRRTSGGLDRAPKSNPFIVWVLVSRLGIDLDKAYDSGNDA